MSHTAIHTIHLRDKNGVASEVEPGEPFVPSSAKEGERLVKIGAAKAAASKAASSKAASSKPEQKDETKSSAKPLDEMTKAELVAYAKEENIEIDESANKGDILETIKADQDSENELL